jgi:hypothetical protein
MSTEPPPVSKLPPSAGPGARAFSRPACRAEVMKDRLETAWRNLQDG